MMLYRKHLTLQCKHHFMFSDDGAATEGMDTNLSTFSRT